MLAVTVHTRDEGNDLSRGQRPLWRVLDAIQWIQQRAAVHGYQADVHKTSDTYPGIRVLLFVVRALA